MSKPGPMKLPPRIKIVAKRISEAANTAIDSYARGQITDEPHITDRWIGAVVGVLSQYPRSYGRGAERIVWDAKTLRASSGRAAEEKRHGADILGVAEIFVGPNVVRKGFLGQAKRSEPGEVLDNAGWDRLQEQLVLMLNRTPTSFVLVYSTRHGIRFIPAITVANFRRRDLFDFNSVSIEEFFQWHLACFIGDHRLDAPDISTLDALSGFSIDHVLHIVLRSEMK